MSVPRFACSLLLVLLVSSRASADTVRVIVDRALVWTRPSGVSVVITQLLMDQTVEVVRRVGDWDEIVVPAGSLQVRTGYILAAQVVVDSVGPPSTRVGGA